MKAVLRGKFIALSAYIKKKFKSSQTNNFMMIHLEVSDKQEEPTHRKSKQKGIIKLKAEINKIE